MSTFSAVDAEFVSLRDRALSREWTRYAAFFGTVAGLVLLRMFDRQHNTFFLPSLAVALWLATAGYLHPRLGRNPLAVAAVLPFVAVNKVLRYALHYLRSLRGNGGGSNAEQEIFSAVSKVLGFGLEEQHRSWSATDITQWVEVRRTAGQVTEVTIMHPADFLVSKHDALDKQVTSWHPNLRLSDRLHGCSIYRVTATLPDSVPFSFGAQGDNKLTFAVGEAGTPVIWDLMDAPHMLVSGPTGGGKTTAVRVIIAAALQSHFAVYACDPKRIELGYLRNRITEVASDTDSMVALVAGLREEMNRRYVGIETADMEGYARPVFPPVLLVIDEHTELISLAGSNSNVTKDLESLARLGRSAHIHLLLATQRPDANALPGALKANVSARLNVGRIDGIASQMVFDNAEAAELIPTGKGGGLFKMGAVYSPCRVMWLANPNEATCQEDKDAAERWLPRKSSPAMVEVPGGAVDIDEIYNIPSEQEMVAPVIRKRREI